MGKRRKADPLIQTIERALDLGRFVSYRGSWKRGLIGGFDAIVAGRATYRPRSFEKRMQAKWKKQASK